MWIEEEDESSASSLEPNANVENGGLQGPSKQDFDRSVPDRGR